MDIAESFEQGFKNEKVNKNGASWVREYRRLAENKNYWDFYTIYSEK